MHSSLEQMYNKRKMTVQNDKYSKYSILYIIKLLDSSYYQKRLDTDILSYVLYFP